VTKKGEFIASPIFFGGGMKYSIGTIVSNWIQYDAMQKSFIAAGFPQSECQYIVINNVGKNNFCMYSGGNTILSQATGDYVILVHQDVVATPDNRSKLDQCIEELEKADGAWAVAGNAGEHEGNWLVRITDPYGEGQSTAPYYPHRVNILDGNLLIVKRNTLVSFSRDLSGFHYYGWDICLNADVRGYNSYIIDFHVAHRCKGWKIQTSPSAGRRSQKNGAEPSEIESSAHFIMTG
jgi:glycosyltransferase involved in cell wall biosynthesis